MDPFESSTVSTILAWALAIGMVPGLVIATVEYLSERIEAVPRTFVVWALINLLLFSPLRYILLQIVIGFAYPFQSFSSFLNMFLLVLYVPIVFGLLWFVGMGLPAIPVVLIAGTHSKPTRTRLWIAAVVMPVFFVASSFLFFAVLPYAAKTVHWLAADNVIRASNGPGYYTWLYLARWGYPLKLPGWTAEVAKSEREIYRAHIAAVYLSEDQFSSYVNRAYPGLQHPRLERR